MDFWNLATFNFLRGNSSLNNIFSIRKANAQQPHSPGGAEDIERWCGLSSSPVVVLSFDEHPVVTHSSSVMVTHAFEVGKTSSCRKTAAANGSWRIKQLCSKSFYIWRQKTRHIDGVLQLRQLGTTGQRCCKWELQGKYYLRRLLLWFKECFHHIANTVWKDHWQTLWNGWFTNKMC